ncbi:hypothetical protein POM88_019310 [Heracleum sosnowskyi]|uniref:rRNA N-glycosylase n=1 Tax=Heracleum sosnowskyi TaxID=360622 RepID=A0AAD8IS45_9APIA|nr:hypothetical protein POM88_019310 [Heracleum sosnowskyi]
MLVIVFFGAAEYEEINGNLAGYNSVTFDLTNGARAYPSFVTRLRNVVEAPARVCATFFIDAPEDAKSNLFRGSTVRTTRFGSGYTSLERVSDVSRLDQQLGIPNLDGAIRSVYGRQENELNQGNGEAKFLFIAVQMVVEATRFQFIVDAIVRNDNMPDFKRKIVSFQNDWKEISKAIYKAEAGTPKCTKISPTLIITISDPTEECQVAAVVWQVDNMYIRCHSKTSNKVCRAASLRHPNTISVKGVIQRAARIHHPNS